MLRIIYILFFSGIFFLYCPSLQAYNDTSDETEEETSEEDESEENDDREQNPKVCSVCHGKLYIEKRLEKKIKCKICKGKGYTTSTIIGDIDLQSMPSTSREKIDCDACDGNGYTIRIENKRIKCPRCKGKSQKELFAGALTVDNSAIDIAPASKYLTL